MFLPHIAVSENPRGKIMANRNISASDSYIDKTSKLIPGEALALFIAMSTTTWQASGMDDERKQWFVFGIAMIIGLAVVPFILYQLQKVSSPRHHAVSIFAFSLWVFNVQYDRLPSFTDEHSTATLVGSLLLGLFTFSAPWFAGTKETP